MGTFLMIWVHNPEEIGSIGVGSCSVIGVHNPGSCSVTAFWAQRTGV